MQMLIKYTYECESQIGSGLAFLLCYKTGGDEYNKRKECFLFSCNLVLHPVIPWYIIDCVK